MRDVIEIDELGQIAVFDAVFSADILMLVMKILAILREAHRGQSLLIEGIMIAAAQVAIQAEDEQSLDAGLIRAVHIRDVARQLPRSRIVLAAQRANAADILISGGF